MGPRATPGCRGSHVGQTTPPRAMVRSTHRGRTAARRLFRQSSLTTGLRFAARLYQSEPFTLTPNGMPEACRGRTSVSVSLESATRSRAHTERWPHGNGAVVLPQPVHRRVGTDRDPGRSCTNQGWAEETKQMPCRCPSVERQVDQQNAAGSGAVRGRTPTGPRHFHGFAGRRRGGRSGTGPVGLPAGRRCGLGARSVAPSSATSAGVQPSVAATSARPVTGRLEAGSDRLDGLSADRSGGRAHEPAIKRPVAWTGRVKRLDVVRGAG